MDDITYEPSMRASERIKDIKAFHEYHKKPIETDEIIDRGIHAFDQLKEIDIQEELLTLKSSLDHMTDEFDLNQLKYTRDLSKFIFSAMIVKDGVLATEFFESPVYSLDMLYHALSSNVDGTPSTKENSYMDFLHLNGLTLNDVTKEISNTSKSLDTWIV